jgi:hypothetical protein
MQKLLELFQDDDGAIASCELQWKTSDNCALRHRIAASVILHALTMFVADMFKSRCQLEVENLFLRHQLNIALRRDARGRASPSGTIFSDFRFLRFAKTRSACPLLRQ